MKLETIGVSPKAIAASIAGYLAPLVVGVIAEQLGAEISVETGTAFLLPLITAAVTFAAAYLARAGLVVNTDEQPVDLSDLPEVEGAEQGDEAVSDPQTFER